MTLSRTPLRASKEHEVELTDTSGTWGQYRCTRCGDSRSELIPKVESGERDPLPWPCTGLKRSGLQRNKRVNPYNAERRARSRTEDGERHTYGPYFRWAVERTCCACGAYPCVPHHLDTVGSGGRDAENLLDTCYACHDKIETEGLSSWEREYGIDAIERASELWAEYSEREAG